MNRRPARGVPGPEDGRPPSYTSSPERTVREALELASGTATAANGGLAQVAQALVARPQPHPAYQRLAEHTESLLAPSVLGPLVDRPDRTVPDSGGCACGEVCVCDVPLSVLRPLVSYFAGMHNGDPCACGDPFCGFATYTTRLFCKGAFFRA